MFVPICLLLSLTFPPSYSFQDRIIGGQPAKISQFPYMVSIQRQHAGNSKLSRHTCGGSLIQPHIILSAAHCFLKKGSDDRFDQRTFVIFAGMTKLQDKFRNQHRTAKEIIIHPYFNPKLLYNDVAIVIVKREFKIVKTVQVVKLATNQLFTDQTPWEKYKSNCFASGWGVVSEEARKVSDILMTVELPLISFDACNKLVYDKEYLHEDQICTLLSGSDTCKGDSGGPLVCNETQVGITSWGKGCAQDNNPAVLARVDKYETWISGIINNTEAPAQHKYGFGSAVSFRGKISCMVLFAVALNK